MATQGDDKLTLVDLLKRQDPDGGLADIAEVMEEDQEIIEDIPWVEANSTIGHQSTIRTGLPTGYWRKLNQGVPNEKATTVQITDTVGMLETYLECDKKLADMSGDKNKFRMDESRSAIEGMSQTLASTIFHGDTEADPEKFLGLLPRYDDLGAGNAANIEDAAESSNLTSIWLVNWRPDKVHGLVPKGSVGGMVHTDKGQETLFDASNRKYEGYRSHLEFNAGLCVRDWRYIVRGAAIDANALTVDAATGTDLVELMVNMLEQIKDLNGSPRFYVSKKVRKFLRQQVRNEDNVNLTLENVAGKRMLEFDGVPIRRTDAITQTEAAPTAA